MKTKQELFGERLGRIKAAVALQDVDRVPVVILNDMFAAQHMGVKLSDFCGDYRLANETMVKSALDVGEIDAVQMPVNYPEVLSLIYYAKVKLPGRELPEDSLWQIDERELMTVEDYDFIIEHGWNAFTGMYMEKRLDNLMARLGPFFMFGGEAAMRFIKEGIVVLSPSGYGTPIEAFCGGRTMAKFMKDLYRMPDKVQAAMDAAMPEYIQNIETQIDMMHAIGVWVGGWRAASEFLSPKLWERFFWPYFKKLVEVVDAKGVIPILHMDSSWDRDLEYFRELPKNKCIFAPDGMTDIYKVKEVLGDMMCIMGDVPPAMLSLGTPDEVYNYSTKLIKEIGPKGYILGQGCDIPYNAKVENVKAMVAAANGR